MAITFPSFAPVGISAPGEITITVDIDTSLGPAQATEDSIVLIVNDVTVDHVITGPVGDVYTASYTTRLFGGLEFQVKVSAEDATGLQELAFLFTTSSAANTRDRDYVYAYFTDNFGSYFPDFTRANRDRYSVFKQFINPIGLEFDRVRVDLIRQNKALSQARADRRELDWLYFTELSASEEFHTRIDANGQPIFISPAAFAIEDINKIPLTPKDDFVAFVSSPLPSRVDPELIREDFLDVILSSISIFNLDVVPEQIPSRLSIELHSGDNLVIIGTDTFAVMTIIKIKGLDEGGNQIEENLTMLEDSHYLTNRIYTRILGVTLEQSPADAEGEIIIRNLPERLIEKAELVHKEDFGASSRNIFWRLNTDKEGSFLDRRASERGKVNDFLRNEDTTRIQESYRLLDISENPIDIVDFVVDDLEDFIYGIDNDGMLYIVRFSSI